MNQRLQIIGLGYIGLPTALLTASHGIPTRGVDINADYVKNLMNGTVEFEERGFENILENVLSTQTFVPSTKIEEAEVFLIVVPTPFTEDKTPDISHVYKAIESIIPFLREGNLIIIESTCPVHTTKKMYDYILQRNPELKDKFYMAYCPERVIPGNIFYELINNDRVIGGIDDVSSKKAKDFYQLFVKGDIHLTNAETAELCKLTENASRDAQIAFANQVSMICDQAGVNPWELIELANKHPRVNILNPGPGVGGHCIAIDPWFLVSEFKETASFIRNVRETNLLKTQWCIEKILSEINALKSGGEDLTVALMGLAYKPNTNDLRESPSLEIYRQLKKLTKADLLLVEPNIKFSDIVQITPFKKAYERADIVVWLVKHDVFRKSNFKNNPKVIDFCGKNALQNY
jgi:UDP-N-acetyl-D-mannosaminuronic acid dehydrogenase